MVCSTLPAVGLLNVLLCSLACIGAVLLSITDHARDQGIYKTGVLVTIFLSFSLSGMMDIAIFYNTKVKIPKHSKTLLTVIAFLIELVLVPTRETSVNNTDVVDVCLVAAIAASLISCCLSMLCTLHSSIMNFSMMMFTQVQGTWIIHISLSSYAFNRNMCCLFFSWHILISFILYILIVIITRYVMKKNIDSKTLGKRKREKNTHISKDTSHNMLIEKDLVNDTVEIEPSFYQKEEIADDVKVVMRHIDDMLLEVSIPLQKNELNKK